MTVKITDHALVRWLERVHGIDMERFRADLGKLAEPYVQMKCMHAEVGGVWFVFDGAILITVTPEKPSGGQLRRHDRHHVNGSGTGADTPTWQAMKRKRSHK